MFKDQDSGIGPFMVLFTLAFFVGIGFLTKPMLQTGCAGDNQVIIRGKCYTYSVTVPESTTEYYYYPSDVVYDFSKT